MSYVIYSAPKDDICNLLRPRKTIYVIYSAPGRRYMELAPPRKTIYGTLPVHLLPLTCLCRIRGNSHELRSPMRDEISVPGLRRGPEFHAGFWAGPVASMMGVAGSGGSHGVRTFYAGFNAGPCFFVRDQALCAARIRTPGCVIGSLSHVECTAK